MPRGPRGAPSPAPRRGSLLHHRLRFGPQERHGGGKPKSATPARARRRAGALAWRDVQLHDVMVSPLAGGGRVGAAHRAARGAQRGARGSFLLGPSLFIRPCVQHLSGVARLSARASRVTSFQGKKSIPRRFLPDTNCQVLVRNTHFTSRSPETNARRRQERAARNRRLYFLFSCSTSASATAVSSSISSAPRAATRLSPTGPSSVCASGTFTCGRPHRPATLVSASMRVR